jgi:two-component system, probable response regulator PhcQ
MRSTILFVDDEANVTAALKRVLRREPWRILEAHSGTEALSLLARETIDVIVSDEQMPGMSGCELLARVCRDHPETVRMILTGHASLETAIRAVNEGEVWRFFVKPCQEADLIISIRQALQQQALQNDNRNLTRRLQEQATTLSELERRNPGITQVEREADGTIIVD